MSLKGKLSALVIMVGLIYMALTAFRAKQDPDPRVLVWSGLITTIIAVVVWFAFHYVWRIPVLGKLVSSMPNLRGTWAFTGILVQELGTTNTPVQTNGFLVIRQSDSHIRVTVLWSSDNDQSEITADAPSSYHLGALAFAGTYKNKKSAKTHGFGAWLTAVGNPVTTTSLRYRTDSGETGQLDARNRVPRSYNDYMSASNAREVRLWERVYFALLPM